VGNATATNQTALHSLADYTRPEWLRLRLKSRSLRGVMEELLRTPPLETSPATVLYAAQTAVNLALLTGRTDTSGVAAAVPRPGEPRPRLILGRASEPLQWRARNLTPVEFVAVLLGPSPGSTEGRQVLAALEHLCQDQACLADLRVAQTAAEMLAVLARRPVLTDDPVPVTPPAQVTARVPQAVALGAKGVLSFGQTPLGRQPERR